LPLGLQSVKADCDKILLSKMLSFNLIQKRIAGSLWLSIHFRDCWNFRLAFGIFCLLFM
jgi:hypothetical protein